MRSFPLLLDGVLVPSDEERARCEAAGCAQPEPYAELPPSCRLDPANVAFIAAIGFGIAYPTGWLVGWLAATVKRGM